MEREAREKVLKEKVEFVNKLGDIIPQFVSHVEKLEYKVFKHIAHDWYDEYLVITFVGGARLARICSGDSHLAILQEIGRRIEGGYYEEVQDLERYESDPNWVLL